MGIIARESFWNSVSTYASIGMAAVNSILLVPWVFDIHPEEEWGLLQYLVGLVTMIGPLTHLGLPNSIVRFMPWFREEGKPEFLWLVTVIVSVSFSLLCLGFLIFYFYLRPDAATTTLTSRFLPLIIPMLAGNTLMNIAGSFAKAHYKTIIAVLVRELPLRVVTFILLILYGFSLIDFQIFIVTYVLTFLLKGLVMFVYVARSGELRYRRPLRLPSRKMTREILVFTLFSFLGGEASAIIGKIDVVLIKQFFDLKEVAYYSIPFYAASLIAAPLRSIAPISYTLISDFWKQNNLVKLQEIYKQTSVNQFLIAGFIFLMLWTNVDLLMFILGDKFGTEAAKWVLLFVALGQLADAAAGTNGQIISASSYYRWGLYMHLIMLGLTISFQLLLIPAMGIVGAAIGAGLAILSFNVMKGVFLRVKFSLRLFNREYYLAALLILFSLLVDWGITWLIPNLYLRVALRIILISALFPAAILWLHISPELRRVMHTGLKRIRRFRNENRRQSD